MANKKRKNRPSNNDREQLLSKFDNLHNNIKKDHSTIPRQDNTYKFVAVAIIIVIGLGGLYALSQFNTSPTSTAPTTTPATTSSVKLSGNYYNDTAATPLFTNNKLTIVYVGAEFCPYCAMERWAIVMALEQYGNFSNLSQITSSEDNVPTYTFVGSTFTSSKIDFQPAEIENNGYPNPSSLQSMNNIQSQLFNKYSKQGYFPFLCIGGKIYQVGAGASFSLGSFSKQSPSTVQNQIYAKSGPLYQQIHTEAVLMTTYINSLLS